MLHTLTSWRAESFLEVVPLARDDLAGTLWAPGRAKDRPVRTPDCAAFAFSARFTAEPWPSKPAIEPA